VTPWLAANWAWVALVVGLFVFRRRIFALVGRWLPALALLIVFGLLVSTGVVDQLADSLG
jgi:hypothetical protein